MKSKRNYTDLTFKQLVESILNEETDELEDFDTTTEETIEDDDDSLDMSQFEEETSTETEGAEGDVSITLTSDEISFLRSILAKVDGVETESEDELEDETIDGEEDEDDDIEIEEEDDFEEDEDEDEIPMPEEDEETIAGGYEGTAVTFADRGTSRKKGAPAVDRTGAKKEGLMGAAKAAGEADTVEMNAGASRKKGAPAISRSGKAASRIAPGKAVIEVGK